MAKSLDIRRPDRGQFWLWFIICAAAVGLILMMVGAGIVFVVISARHSPTAPRASGDDRAYLLEPLGSPVRSIAVSPDGKTVVAGCHDGSIRQWDIKSGDPGPVIQGHQGIVAGVAFTPDGQTLVSASHDRTVKVWDARTGQAKRTFPGHAVAIWSLAVAGNVAATAGPYNEQNWPVSGEVRVWNLTPGKEKDLGAVPAKFAGITSLAIAPDSGSIFAASTDGIITRWDLAGEKVKATYKGHLESVWALALSLDGKLVAAGAHSGEVRVWDVESTKELHVLRGPRDPLRSMVFTPDGKVLATVAHDRTIRFWDTRTGILLTSVKDEDCHPSYLAVTPNGKTLVVGRVQYDEFDTPLIGDVKVWDLERVLAGARAAAEFPVVAPQPAPPPVPPRTVPFLPVKKERPLPIMVDTPTPPTPAPLIICEPRESFIGHEKLVTWLAVAPDGKTLASASWDATVRLWDLNPCKERAVLRGHDGMVHVLTFSPDGNTLASAGLDHIVHLWELPTHKERKLGGLKNDIYSLAFSPDGKTIAAASTQQSEAGNVIRSFIHIQLWDTETGEVRGSIKGKAGSAVAMAFVQEGKTLAVVDGAAVLTFWDLATLHSRGEVKLFPPGLTSMAATTNGAFLATGARDRMARLWDATNGNEVKVLRGQKSMIGGVAFNKTGNLLATATGDRYGDDISAQFDEVRLWEVPVGKPRAILRGMRHSMVAVTFSPDGKSLFTGGTDGVIHRWDVPPKDVGSGPVAIVASEDTNRAEMLIIKQGGKLQREGNEIVRVYLAGAKVTDVELSALCKLNWVRELWLDDTPISDADLDRLKGLSQLEQLSLIRTKVSAATAAAFKKALPNCWLTLSEDGLRNGMINENQNLQAALRGMGGRIAMNPKGDIVSIDLGRTDRKITSAGLGHLQGLTKLKVLNIYGVPKDYLDITDEGMQHLRGLESLERLEASWTMITDAGLMHLKDLPALKSVSIRGTQVTDAGVEAFLAHQPKCEISR